MADEKRDIGGVQVLLCAPDGAVIGSERDAVDLVSAALSTGAELVAIPVQRLDPAFFQLSTRFAGDLIQKLVNYRLRVAIVGDIAAHMAASAALRDFVRESNRGEQVWFVNSAEELAEHLTRR